MSDILYKKFSQLTEVTSLANGDILPIAQDLGGSYGSKKVTYNTLYKGVSAQLITPFTSSIQTTILAGLSTTIWNSTYTTVKANSASWDAAAAAALTAFTQGGVASPQPVRFLSAGTSPASVALVATGTGATLAQIPDGTPVGGDARGQYATDWQKSRTSQDQIALGPYSVICGGDSNTADGYGSAVGGGASNSARGGYSTIGGGMYNTARGPDSTIGGGTYNIAGGVDITSTIGGGMYNTASGSDSTIGGGSGNTASGSNSTIGGGSSNTASGSYSIIGGGVFNIADGSFTSIIGGANNKTNNKYNTHIIGSNITAVSADHTYVNNLSTPGTVTAGDFKGPPIVKAWANFSGVGTGSGTPTIYDSYNVSKIQRVSEGVFNIEFNPNTFTTASYIMCGSVSNNENTSVIIRSGSETGAPTLKTSLSCQVALRFSGAARQAYEIGVAFMGR